MGGGEPGSSRRGSSAGTRPPRKRSRRTNQYCHNRPGLSKVAVIGGGYVGLTTGACLADLGNMVTIVDVHQEKIVHLKRHPVPFYEPALRELVVRNARAGRPQFTTPYLDAVPGAEF